MKEEEYVMPKKESNGTNNLTKLHGLLFKQIERLSDKDINGSDLTSKERNIRCGTKDTPCYKSS